MQIFDIHFLQSLFFYSFILVPIFLYLYIRQQKKSALKINFGEDLEEVFGKNNKVFSIKLIFILLILSTFILLLADPNKANIKQNITKNGIDIVIALDISKSMEASDLKPNRLEKAKETITSFIEKQQTNRVGLIVFAGKPLSSVPLTFDYNILTETLENLSTDTLNQNVNGLDGTAIGDSLLLGKNLFSPLLTSPQGISEERSETTILKLKQSRGIEQNNSSDSFSLGGKDAGKADRGPREKTIILLTDGDANRGVDPVVASKFLGEEKIKIYTIGIGSAEGGLIEVQNGPFRQQVQIPPLNAASLKEIAKNTSGYFFRATDNSTLEKIFKKLEELEKNDIEVKIVKSFSEYYKPFTYILILLISGLLFFEIKRVKTH